jgi:hypothetical protein
MYGATLAYREHHAPQESKSCNNSPVITFMVAHENLEGICPIIRVTSSRELGLPIRYLHSSQFRWSLPIKIYSKTTSYFIVGEFFPFVKHFFLPFNFAFSFSNISEQLYKILNLYINLFYASLLKIFIIVPSRRHLSHESLWWRKCCIIEHYSGWDPG